ncbi:MAG TPA: homoserine O-succinyltransferase [Caulobacteraceae bacterium]|nr:homoserine O-succinyltransferase [Caulobacteraceae bacterium]
MTPRAPLVIGLANNMPDGALQATERQFEGLLAEAARGADVSLRYLSLPEIERGEHARAHMRGRYAHIDRLPAAGLDGLIVTGAEPQAARLDDEPYWPSLARVVDWSRAAEIPTVWSCLAAHAAVLHLDGVERRPLPTKRTGVFASTPARRHALLVETPRPIAPHSRLNEVAEADLLPAGYQVLTRSPEIGVDLFIKPGPALALFFQGHPEYAAETLLREYLRDVGRYLRGERAVHPAPPAGYFGARTLDVLGELASAREARRDPRRITDYVRATDGASAGATWRPWAVGIYRAWLEHIWERKAGRVASPEAGALASSRRGASPA